MKTKKFKILPLVLLTIILTGSTVMAQGWRNGNRQGFRNGYGNRLQYTCINQILGLTEEQQSKITELNIEHQKAMVEMRINHRSTLDAIEKNEIRGEMLKKVKSHREEVRSLLTEEQQKEYELFQSQRYSFRRQGLAQGRRNAPGRAGFAGNGRGRMGNRGMNFRRGPCFYNN